MQNTPVLLCYWSKRHAVYFKSKSADYCEWLPSECEINDALKWKQRFGVAAAPAGATSLGNLWVLSDESAKEIHNSEKRGAKLNKT